MRSELGALLVVQRLCVPCLAEKTNMAPGAVRARVDQLGSLVLVRPQHAPCDACRTLTTTYGVQ